MSLIELTVEGLRCLQRAELVLDSIVVAQSVPS
jgi:hypothetical protein